MRDILAFLGLLMPLVAIFILWLYIFKLERKIKDKDEQIKKLQNESNHERRSGVMIIQEFLDNYEKKSGMTKEEIRENKKDFIQCMYLISSMTAAELEEVKAYCKARLEEEQ